VRAALGEHIATLTERILNRLSRVRPHGQASRSGNLQTIFLTDERNEIAIHKFSLDMNKSRPPRQLVVRLPDVPRRRNLRPDRTVKSSGRHWLVKRQSMRSEESNRANADPGRRAHFPTGKYRTAFNLNRRSTLRPNND